MDDLIDGKVKGWPASLLIQRAWVGAKADGAHCCSYTDDDDSSAPVEIQDLCAEITDACDGLSPSRSLRKAISLGFVPDVNEND